MKVGEWYRWRDDDNYESMMRMAVPRHPASYMTKADFDAQYERLTEATFDVL